MRTLTFGMGIRLHQSQGSYTLGVRKHGQSEKETNKRAILFHFTSWNVGEYWT
jgi:hypothetical protein